MHRGNRLLRGLLQNLPGIRPDLQGVQNRLCRRFPGSGKGPLPHQGMLHQEGVCQLRRLRPDGQLPHPAGLSQSPRLQIRQIQTIHRLHPHPGLCRLSGAGGKLDRRLRQAVTPQAGFFSTSKKQASPRPLPYGKGRRRRLFCCVLGRFRPAAFSPDGPGAPG